MNNIAWNPKDRRWVFSPLAELKHAFGCGRGAARRGETKRANPYKPSSEANLWAAWSLGFADYEERGGRGKKAVQRRNQVEAVIAAHGPVCWLCHKEITPGQLSMDHVLPKSKGGTRARENLRPAHSLCNSRRGNGPPPELLLTADMMLRET